MKFKRLPSDVYFLGLDLAEEVLSMMIFDSDFGSEPKKTVHETPVVFLEGKTHAPCFFLFFGKLGLKKRENILYTPSLKRSQRVYP